MANGESAIARGIRAIRLPHMLVLAALFLAMTLLINGSWIGTGRLTEITGGVNILDFETGYTPEAALDHLDRMGEAGRSHYRSTILPLDFAFPLSYALLYAGVIAYLLKGRSGRLRWLLCLPALTMLLDYAENLCILAMLHAFPLAAPAAARAASALTACKFFAIGLNVAAMLGLAIWQLYDLRRQRKGK